MFIILDYIHFILALITPHRKWLCKLNTTQSCRGECQIRPRLHYWTWSSETNVVSGLGYMMCSFGGLVLWISLGSPADMFYRLNCHVEKQSVVEDLFFAWLQITDVPWGEESRHNLATKPLKVLVWHTPKLYTCSLYRVSKDLLTYFSCYLSIVLWYIVRRLPLGRGKSEQDYPSYFKTTYQNWK